MTTAETLQAALTAAYDVSVKSTVYVIAINTEHVFSLQKQLNAINPSWGLETQLMVVSAADRAIAFNKTTLEITGVPKQLVFVPQETINSF
jgi:hypothetical protein